MTKELAPHQQRVVDEKVELDVKLAKLENFLLTPLHDGLPEAERSRLARQHNAMHDYSRVLGERIRAFLA